MKRILYTILLLFVFSSLLYCANDSEKNNKKVLEETKQTRTIDSKDDLNISLLLDLSDRINPEKYPNESMEYYERDIAYIKSVSEAFETHLRAKKVRQMNDKIQLYFDPEPKNQNINKISTDLKYHISRSNVSLELLNDLEEQYSSKPAEIYNLAIKDNYYVGSDIWRFFKTKVKDYCVEDNFRNILIILTDGYIYHKDTKLKETNRTSYLTPQDIRDFRLNKENWENRFINDDFGFITAIEDLSNLEVLVLGINPDNKNPYEEEVLKKYWSDWFNTMNVLRYDIKTAELPSNMDKLIKDFILKD